MSVSTLSFSATLPPFYNTNGNNTTFSNSNSSFNGNVLLANNSDSSGNKSTTISSTATRNGLSYSETGATINGNQLTINYQTDNVNADTLNTLLGANLHGSGANFSPTSATASSSGTLTTIYNTNPNSNFNQLIQGAGRSTASGDGQNIQLENISAVGNTLTLTFDLGQSSPNTVDLAPAYAPPPEPTQNSTPQSNSNGASFSSAPYETIGDLLAGSSGFANGSIGGALQAGIGQSGISNQSSNAILAATLQPSINLSPSTSLQVADFANIGFGSSSSFTTVGSSSSSSNQSGSDSNSNFGSSNGNATPTGIYNAIANASASNIIGGNLNTIA